MSAARPGACVTRHGPARGSRSESPRGPPAASPRTPGRSCRSRRSAAPPEALRRSRSSADARAGTPRRRCPPAPPPIRPRRPRPGCAAAACGSSTRTAPWPRRGPHSTAVARALGPGRPRATSPARSCRRPRVPPRARACRASSPGMPRVLWTRPAGIPLRAAPRRGPARSPAPGRSCLAARTGRGTGTGPGTSPAQ